MLLIEKHCTLFQNVVRWVLKFDFPVCVFFFISTSENIFFKFFSWGEILHSKTSVDICVIDKYAANSNQHARMLLSFIVAILALIFFSFFRSTSTVYPFKKILLDVFFHFFLSHCSLGFISSFSLYMMHTYLSQCSKGVFIQMMLLKMCVSILYCRHTFLLLIWEIEGNSTLSLAPIIFPFIECRFWVY